jgi:hypothetical protein
LGDPYEVAGVAVPDWLGLTRPRLRCRSRQAAPFAGGENGLLASVARGVMRHHADDDWFHQTTAFMELSAKLSRRIRQATADQDGVRPSFLGHILVELLLDATLIEQDRSRVDSYYAALAMVDPRRVATIVGQMIDADASPLGPIIERFLAMRFLYDYLEDQRLAFRLNQVMRRVGLPELPPAFVSILPEARRLVALRCEEFVERRAIVESPMLAAA